MSGTRQIKLIKMIQQLIFEHITTGVTSDTVEKAKELIKYDPYTGGSKYLNTKDE